MIITVTLNPALDKTLEVAAFKVGQHARATRTGLLPAGKGINVARGVQRLGVSCVATGLVGKNEMPLFAEQLSRDKVHANLCTVDGLTRTNTTILDPEEGTTTHLREQGFQVVPEDLQKLKTVLSEELNRPKGSVWISFCGSLPPGISLDEFVELIRICATDASVIVDTSGPALRASIDSGVVNTVKPNIAELGEYFELELQVEDAVEKCRELLSLVPTVLLTAGAEGAYLVREGETLGVSCNLPADDVKNTVGTGDAFLAGWFSALESGSEGRAALFRAVAAGAAAARSETTVGYHLADIEELLPECREL